MTYDQWNDVDQYINDLLVPHDAALQSALEAATAAGLPPIAVSPAMGKLLHILARTQRARSVLEIGTLGAYSTIWLARALPGDGRVVTLEIDPAHAEVARASLDRAGLSQVVDVRLGPAIETLPILLEEGAGPFDFVFIDADKQSNADYFEWALRLARVGTTIVVDNVVRNGAVIDAASEDAAIQGTRQFNDRLAGESRVVATEIQTVGSKGYDGFALALVVE